MYIPPFIINMILLYKYRLYYIKTSFFRYVNFAPSDWNLNHFRAKTPTQITTRNFGWNMFSAAKCAFHLELELTR